jgi:aquaporin Z
MKKYLGEFIGAFLVILTIILTANNGSGSTGMLAVGAVLAAMTYAGSATTGAHYNPVITLVVFLRGKIDRTDFFYYILAQLAGGILAALMASFMLHCEGLPEIRLQQHETICSLMAEFIGTFALTYVYLNVMEHREKTGNGYYGAAVGAILAALMYALGPVSGGAFNPATAVGMALSGMAAPGDLWIYLAGSLLGGGVAMTTMQGDTPAPIA